jgi:hypothetical protein
MLNELMYAIIEENNEFCKGMSAVVDAIDVTCLRGMNTEEMFHL